MVSLELYKININVYVMKDIYLKLTLQMNVNNVISMK